MNSTALLLSQNYSVRWPPSLFFSKSQSRRRRFVSRRVPGYGSTPRAVKVRYKSADMCLTKSSFSNKAVAKLLAVVEEGSLSPMKNTPWLDVMAHTSTRLTWIDEGYEMLVCTDKELVQSLQLASKDKNKVKSILSQTDIVVAIHIKSHESAKFLQQNTQAVSTVVFFDSLGALENKLGGLQFNNASAFDSLMPFGKRKESSEVLRTVHETWNRYSSDDIRFALLNLINSFVSPVAVLQNLRASGISTVYSIVKNCRSQLVKCLMDPNCRKAIACMNKCSPTDQVCNYRCICSYESPELEAFSRCVLQKNNCLCLDATIPEKPIVQPLTFFRGKPLTHEVAEDIFVGWLGELQSSWRVAAGQNPAYDHFPCQYQLFYRGKAKGSFWYEPIFKAHTLDGKIVWRKRKYKGQRGSIPGTFYFTVSDNGVISREYWRIVEMCDDFRWGLFFYSGAATAAGQSYTGAIIVTPDGCWPSEGDTQMVNSSLEKCGIKDWELFTVNNSCCSDPPLNVPKGSKYHLQIDIKSSSFSL